MGGEKGGETDGETGTDVAGFWLTSGSAQRILVPRGGILEPDYPSAAPSGPSTGRARMEDASVTRIAACTKIEAVFILSICFVGLSSTNE